MTFKERLFNKIRKKPGCWEWKAHISQAGYGQLKGRGKKVVYAHRAVYEMLVGPIPKGLTIDHLCRNRACVNPNHMEPVTSVENVMRGQGPFAVNARKTHCKRGHEFTGDNTYRSRKGRECRKCKKYLMTRWLKSKQITKT